MTDPYIRWLSGKRHDVLDMALAWENHLALNGAALGVDSNDIAHLLDLRNAALNLYTAAYDADRTPAMTAELNAAFDLLREHMMFMKERYFHTPPLAEKDYAAMMLTPRDRTPTHHGAPESRVIITISYSGAHGLILNFKNAPGEEPPKGKVSMIVFQGIRPQGGAQALEVARNKILLMDEPASIKDLMYWRRTSRRKEERIFEAEYAGMTAYFIACYENDRGQVGPPGFMVNAIIP